MASSANLLKLFAKQLVKSNNNQVGLAILARNFHVILWLGLNKIFFLLILIFLKNNSVLFTPPMVTSPKSQQAAEKIADKKVKVTLIPGDGN